MSKKLYVGNLAYTIKSADLETAFSQYGTVTSATVLTDRDTGRSKGFGFIEMSSTNEASAAISGMNGHSLNGRDLIVNEARPQEKRSGSFGGGSYRSNW